MSEYFRVRKNFAISHPMKLRVGIYLGRHRGDGGGIGVYARGLIQALLELLSQSGYEDFEIVLYGDYRIFTPEICDELELSPVLCDFAESALPRGASRYFQPLPNRAQCRVLARVLPDVGHQVGLLLDQFLLPYYLKLDRIDVLHSLANCGIAWTAKKQVVTVHDLFQAWMPDDSGDATPSTSLRSKARSLCFRALFRAQFRRAAHVFTDNRRVRLEVLERFALRDDQVESVPLGLSEFWVQAAKLCNEKASTLVEERVKFKRNFQFPDSPTVILGSTDPRKNLHRALESWGALDETLKSRRLVITSSDGSVGRLARSVLPNDFSADRVLLMGRLSPLELLLTYRSAGVVFLPSLAEGFGFPALEALACGAKVVSGSHEYLEQLAPEGFAVCNPLSAEDMTQQLRKMLERNKPPPARLDERKLERPQVIAENLRMRTMVDVVRIYLGRYRSLHARVFR